MSDILVPMRRSLSGYYFLSAIIHLALFSATAIFVVSAQGKPAAAPVKVNLIYAESPKNKDMDQGRVEDLPKPDKVEIPDTADVLSRYDSRAHSPEKGKNYKARKTVLPREEVDLPHPSMKKSRENMEETRPEKPQTQVAALKRPTVDLSRKDTVRDVNIFSSEVVKKAIEAERAKKFEKDDQQREEKRKSVSSRPTDNPNPSNTETAKLSGVKGIKGADIEKFAMSATADVIDMGDEAIVSLNTRAFKYIDYFSHIKKAVELVWTYPDEAIVQGYHGSSVVRFTLKSTGELEEIKVIRSSGHKVLDDEALIAVKVAAPYNAFPKNLDKKKLHIVATFIYQPSFNNIK